MHDRLCQPVEDRLALYLVTVEPYVHWRVETLAWWTDA